MGAVILAVWLVGWLAFGMHDGLWHALVPLGGVMLIAQGVRRIAYEPH
jgi:hypothetical protein